MIRKYFYFTKQISFLAMCLFAEASFAADQMYRYEGANGEMVIEDHIPPEFVHKGYAIINKSGFVIEKVEPTLSKDDVAGLSEARQAEELKKEQAKRDAWLLERYSDAGDAILARDRQLGSLETLIIVAQININKLKKDENKELTLAAEAERQGKEIPPDVISSLESIRAQIRTAELQVENQKQEQTKINEKFGKIIDRLTEIEKEKGTLRR